MSWRAHPRRPAIFRIIDKKQIHGILPESRRPIVGIGRESLRGLRRDCRVALDEGRLKCNFHSVKIDTCFTITPPAVSIPSESGATSNSKRSLNIKLEGI